MGGWKSDWMNLQSVVARLWLVALFPFVFILSGKLALTHKFWLHTEKNKESDCNSLIVFIVSSVLIRFASFFFFVETRVLFVLP